MSTNKFTTESSREHVPGVQSSSKNYIASVYFGDEEDDLSTNARQPSQQLSSGLRTSTPGNRQSSIMDDFSSRSNHSETKQSKYTSHPIPEPHSSLDVESQPDLPSNDPSQQQFKPSPSQPSNSQIPEQSNSPPNNESTISEHSDVSQRISNLESSVDGSAMIIPDEEASIINAQSVEEMYKGDREVAQVTYRNSTVTEREGTTTESRSDSDVVIEETYVEEEGTKPAPSSEDVLFTVLTPVPNQNHSVDSVNDHQSVSSSTAELLQVLNADDIEFDASQFKATSTPMDGRTVSMKRMVKGREDSYHGQTSEEELRSYMVSPPPSNRNMSSEKSLSSALQRPSILKQRTSFPDIMSDLEQASNGSGRTNSKVKFQDKIQTTYINQTELNDREQTPESLLMNTGEILNLDLPQFTQNCPSHLSELPPETLSSSTETRRESEESSLGSDSNLKSASMMLRMFNNRNKESLRTSSLPLSVVAKENGGLQHQKSAPALTEKEVRDFVKEVLDVTQSTTDIGKPKTASDMQSGVSCRVEDNDSPASKSALRVSEANQDTSSHSVLRDADSTVIVEPSELLLRVASTLILSLDSGVITDYDSTPSLQKLLQDVKLLEENLPVVTSAPVYTSASVLLEKLMNNLKFKENPSLTATYLEYLNCFEPLVPHKEQSLPNSGSDVSAQPSKKLFSTGHHSAPVVRLQDHMKTSKRKAFGTKKFPTDVNFGQNLDCDSDFASKYWVQENWNRIQSWLSLQERNNGNSSNESDYGTAYPDDSSAWSIQSLHPSHESLMEQSLDDLHESDKSKDITVKATPAVTLSTSRTLPPAGGMKKPSSKLYAQENVRSPRTRNQVLVNQAIVDMVNAVTLYEYQMSDRNAPHVKSEQAKPRQVNGNEVEGPQPNVAPTPGPVPQPSNPQQPNPDQPCPEQPNPEQTYGQGPTHERPINVPSGTDAIINSINDRLFKMRAADEGRYNTVVSDPLATDRVNIYTEISNRPGFKSHRTNSKQDKSEFSNEYVGSSGQSAEDSSDKCGMNGKNDMDGMNGTSDHIHDNLALRLHYGTTPYLQQKSGASLPTSRVASPDPDKILGGKPRKTAMGDASKYLIEKEVLESQVRRLQVENSTLQTENKLLKEKFNRGQARISLLESQNRNTQQEALHMNEEISDKMSEYKRHARSRTEKDLNHSHEQILELTRELEMLKAENTSLQKQLVTSRRSADVMRSSNSTDHSRIIESFKVDIFSLKDEVKRAKQLLAESERSREQEAGRRKDAAVQVVKLTEMKALLQQQIENSGSSVAEKQVKSIERRLKITEDRLHQERADRASKLSDVEETLIHENARLQVLEKELKRQLTREREKHRTVDQKFKDLREENERLRIQLADKPVTDSINNRNKKHQVDEYKYLLDCIKHEDNLGPGQEQEIICLLWQRKESLARLLKAWEISLDEVKVEHGNITQGLKIIRDERGILEDRISRYKDTLEDVTQEKEEMENLLRGKIKDLTQTKHNSSARLQNLEDLSTAVSAENDSLRASLKMSVGTRATKCPRLNTTEALVEELRGNVFTSEANLEQKRRSIRLMQTELESTKNRLSSKEAALDEALSEINRMQASHLDGGDLLDRKQQQIDRLNAEIVKLQADVKLWHEKMAAASRERAQLEGHVEELSRFKSRSKFTADASSHLDMSEKLALEKELREKDNQILKLSVKYNECENELQRSKQRNISSHETAEKLDSQLNQLQVQLRQKKRMLERMSSTESDHVAQIQALRENLTTANKELSEKTAQLRIMETEKEILKDKVGRLEVGGLDQQATNLQGTSDAQQHILNVERENAQRDMDRANAAMNMIMRENNDLMSRVRELRQELVKERTRLSQMTSDKGNTEQQLHICCEERSTLQAEKDKLKSDLGKVSSDMSLSLYKLESDVPSSDFEAHYHNLTPQGKKIAVELGTVHKLLETREREAVLFKDTLDRQKDEVQSLNRKIELLRGETVISRDNVDHLTNELSQKVKENASTVEANQSLASEKTRLQMENLHLEKDVGHGGSEMGRRLNELQELTRKLEKAEDRFRDAERLLHQKETTLVAMETEMKHINRNIKSLESENGQLKTQLESFNQESRSLRSVNAALEHRLSNEKSVLNEEKLSVRQLSQDLTSANHQIESAKQDYDMVLGNLEDEQKKVQHLQAKIQQLEDKIYELEDRVTSGKLGADTLSNHLSEARSTIDQYKQDKQTLYKDVQDLCRKLAEKDENITRLQEKSHDTVGLIQKEFTTEKTFIIREKDRLELDLANAKEEIDALNERMKRKDLQIEAYMRTTQDLDNEKRVKQELENQILKLENDLTEARQTLNTLHLESKRRAEEHKHALDNLDKTQTQLMQVRDNLKTQREQCTHEIHQLRQTLTEEAHKHELEKSRLNEGISKGIAQLHATEVSLASVTENKDSLHEDTKGLEKSVEALRSQLHEEITARKLAEHKCDTYKSQAEDLRLRKNAIDERNFELQAAYAKLEAECNSEKDKYNRLKQEMSDERSTSSNVEAHAMALHTQVAELQAEVSSLRSQLESQKQNFQGKNKRLMLEMKQQMENFDKERSKLVMQMQQISVDLESAREQVATKNREQLKLQEEILGLEEKFREASSDLKHVKESLRIEEQHREKLELRNQELELRYRVRSDEDSEASRLSATRAEIGKVMSDMKKKMELQLEQSKSAEKELIAKHQQLMEEHKRKITNLDSSLSQERSMHLVTKTQLASLDDDNQRLRTQLQAARKRSTPPEERTKSRMEEINEIIARSQTRAQQMLASGAYGDESLRSTGRELLSPVPMMHLNTSIISDGNKSMASDDISKDL